MRLLHAHALAAVLGALCSLPVGDEAAIRLPSGPVKPTPPAPSPDAVQKLTADLLYVVEAPPIGWNAESWEKLPR